MSNNKKNLLNNSNINLKIFDLHKSKNENILNNTFCYINKNPDLNNKYIKRV